MQPNQIVAGGVHYNRDGGESINRSTYMCAENHTLTSRSLLQLYRTYAKRSGNSRGSSKVAIKATRDVSVPNADGSGNIVLPQIVEVSISTPIGAEATAIDQSILISDLLSVADEVTGQPVVNQLITKLDI